MKCHAETFKKALPLTIKIVTQFNLSIYKDVTISLACQPEFIEGCTGAAFNVSHTSICLNRQVSGVAEPYRIAALQCMRIIL